MDEPLPRQLQERTGRHHCVRCLAVINLTAMQQNDFLCDRCAEDGDYPLASTPDAPAGKREKS